MHEPNAIYWTPFSYLVTFAKKLLSEPASTQSCGCLSSKKGSLIEASGSFYYPFDKIILQLQRLIFKGNNFYGKASTNKPL